MVEVI